MHDVAAKTDKPLVAVKPESPSAGLSESTWREMQRGTSAPSASDRPALREESRTRDAAAALPRAADVFFTSDAERMKSVDRNSAEVNKLFPNESSSDINNPKNAAYRYLMNKECVDDYSSSSKQDAEILEKASPGIIKKLDDIVREHLKSGPAPGSHCDVPMS